MINSMTWFKKYAQLRPISPQEIKDLFVRHKPQIYGIGGMLAGNIAAALAHKYAKNKAYEEANKHVKTNKSLADDLAESFIKKHKLGNVTITSDDSGGKTPSVKVTRKNGQRRVRITVPESKSPYSNIDDPVVRLLALGRAKAAISSPKTEVARQITESIPYKASAFALRLGMFKGDKGVQRYTSLGMRSLSPQLQAGLNVDAQNYALKHLKEEAPEELQRGAQLSNALHKAYKYEQVKPISMFASSRLGLKLGRKLGGG